MKQNFGSKPQINCNTIKDTVMTIGVLYLMSFRFIEGQVLSHYDGRRTAWQIPLC